jgi:hypothetical protein
VAYLLKSQALIPFSANAFFLDEKEPKETRLARYREAVTSLEKYLDLAPNSENKELWKDQLGSLRFLLTSPKNNVYTGREVTT